MNGRSRIEPTLSRRLPRQACRVEQDAARDDAVLQRINVSSRAAAGGLDLIHRHAVVAFPFRHDVAIHRVEMTVDDPVVRAGVLVLIERNTRSHVEDFTLEYRRGIHSTFLNHIVSQRYRDSVLRQRQGLLPFRRRDEIGRAELVFVSPAAPVRKFLHRAPEIRVGRDLRACGVLRLCVKRGGECNHEQQTLHSHLRGASYPTFFN